jgi:hypothetical protein
MPELQKMIHLLEAQLGYSEQGGGYTKFGNWYGHTVEFDSDYSAQPWCDMFLSWAAHKLGYQEWFGQFAYTVDHAKWFVDHGAWGATPEPGAVVFYDWSGSGTVDGIDHVGMVISVDGDTIHTIEGNVDGAYVKEKVRDQSFVVGYGYPDKIKSKLAAKAPAQASSATATTAHAASLTGAVAAGPHAGPHAGAAPVALAVTAPAMTLAAAESPLGATTVTSVSLAGGTGELAAQQPGLGTGVLVIPVLIAALIVIAYVKARYASVLPALAVARFGQDRHSRTAASPTPYRSANSASFATASRPLLHGRTIMRSTPSSSQPAISPGPDSE